LVGPLRTLNSLESAFSALILPRIYMRLTDDWVELTVRFLCKDHDIRGLKDRMSREIIGNLEKARIGIASSTYEIVGMLAILVQMESPVDKK